MCSLSVLVYRCSFIVYSISSSSILCIVIYLLSTKYNVNNKLLSSECSFIGSSISCIVIYLLSNKYNNKYNVNNESCLPSSSSGSSSDSKYPSKSSSLSSDAMPAMYSRRKFGSDGK